MKRILKVSGVILLSIILLITIAGFIISEDLPEGKRGPEADELAGKILEELNYKAYQETSFISWTFAGIHSYDWYKAENYVIVTSGDDKIKLDLNDYSKSEIISSDTSNPNELIETSIKNFNNDSFWLIAPFKLMEDNVERRIVEGDNGDKNLLVTFTSGGSTPGDSYLWKVDENYRPVSYKMWVSVIPVGGLEAKWKDWVETQSGVILSTEKSIFGIPISITNLETRR